MSKRTVTYRKLTYSELLATIPWVSLIPDFEASACGFDARWHRGRTKPCKAPARLRYQNLDGTVHHFCHHHLYVARLSRDHIMEGDPGYEEAVRNDAWFRKATFETDPATVVAITRDGPHLRIVADHDSEV